METIIAYARDMRDFLNESELTEPRAFIESFVKETVVMPGDALMCYTVPMADDSLIPGRAAEKVTLNGSVLPTVKNGGPNGIRTHDLRNASAALFRLSYRPSRAANEGGESLPRPAGVCRAGASWARFRRHRGHR